MYDPRLFTLENLTVNDYHNYIGIKIDIKIKEVCQYCEISEDLKELGVSDSEIMIGTNGVYLEFYDENFVKDLLLNILDIINDDIINYDLYEYYKIINDQIHILEEHYPEIKNINKFNQRSF